MGTMLPCECRDWRVHVQLDWAGQAAAANQRYQRTARRR
jgi:hypothetical protein